MGRGSKKPKVVKKALGDTNVFGAFNELLGLDGGSADYDIIYNKYKEYRKNILNILKCVGDFKKIFFQVHKNKYNKLEKQFENFIKKYLKDMSIAPEMSLKLLAKKLNKPLCLVSILEADEEFKELFFNRYKSLKESDVVGSLIVYCNNLKRYHRYIGEKESLSFKFVNRSDIDKMRPFMPLLEMDFVYMLRVEKDEMVKNCILQFLHNMYKLTHKIYELRTSPDIDTDKLVDFILSNIEGIQDKDPRLKRCRNAFKKLKNATELLRGNIGQYYKDFISTKNPSVMLESFVIDVANDSTNESASLMSEFKYILKFIKDKLKNNNDPRIASLLSHLDSNFSVLEKEYGNVDILEETEEDNKVKEEKEELDGNVNKVEEEKEELDGNGNVNKVEGEQKEEQN